MMKVAVLRLRPNLTHRNRGGATNCFELVLVGLTWDMAGNILSVVPTANAWTYSIQCD